MTTLLRMFMAHGGSPNTVNMNNETCLHAVCQEPNYDERKRNILLSFVQWKEEYTLEEGHNEVVHVSVNMVDNDGNTACHYAASSGLDMCVQELVRRGAIISIVNRDQMTCCECADARRYNHLANSLELALGTLLR